MQVDTPVIDFNVPDDDHRYFGFPFHLVFDASAYVLERMGLRISYSSLYKGRIIASRGTEPSARNGFLDIRLIGMGSVTLVHVRVGSGTISVKDDTAQLRIRFFWELDEWLHAAKVEELNKVQDMSAKYHGRPTREWVPPSTAYKITSVHTHPRGARRTGLVWVPGATVPWFGWGSPSGAPAGLRGRWDPNPTPGGLLSPSRGHRDTPGPFGPGVREG